MELRGGQGRIQYETCERGRELLRPARAALAFVAFFYGDQSRRTTSGQQEGVHCWRFLPAQRRHAGCDRWRADHHHGSGRWRFIRLVSWRVSNVSTSACRSTRCCIGEHCQQPESIQGNALLFIRESAAKPARRRPPEQSSRYGAASREQLQQSWETEIEPEQTDYIKEPELGSLQINKERAGIPPPPPPLR